MIARGLAIKADLAVAVACRADREANQGLHRGVPFIEEVRDQGRIPLETEGKLGQSIGPDGAE